MLCMLKVSKKLKMVLHIFAHNFFNIQLIFNPKKFWKAGTTNAMYVEACQRC